MDILISFLKYSWNFTKNHETLVGSFIGAFVAALFGIVAQLVVNKLARTEAIRKSARNLYLDFKYVLQDIRTITQLRNFYENFYTSEDGVSGTEKCMKLISDGLIHKFNTNWREPLSVISDVIEDSYYEEIRRKYHALEQVHNAIYNYNSKSLDMALLIFNIDDMKSNLFGYESNTNEKILKSLELLSKGKIKKAIKLNKAEKRLSYEEFSKLYNNKIEKQIIDCLKSETSIEISLAIEKVKEWLKKEEKNVYEKYNFYIERIVSDIIYNSKNITYDENKDFGYIRLRNSKDKVS